MCVWLRRDQRLNPTVCQKAYDIMWQSDINSCEGRLEVLE